MKKPKKPLPIEKRKQMVEKVENLVSDNPKLSKQKACEKLNIKYYEYINWKKRATQVAGTPSQKLNENKGRPSLEDKKILVGKVEKLRSEKQLSIKNACKEVGMSHFSFKDWVKQISKNGTTLAVTKRTYKKRTPVPINLNIPEPITTKDNPVCIILGGQAAIKETLTSLGTLFGG